MQKTPPQGGDGAVLLAGNEQACPTKFRPIIQATPPMIARLRKLTWAWPWVPIRRRKIARQGGAT